MSNGNKCYSRNIPIRCGVIQGDIPSPLCFLVALDKLLKENGGTNVGINITENLLLKDLEFADDAALPDRDIVTANNSSNAQQEAVMCISVPKRKVQHIKKCPQLTKQRKKIL